MEALPRSVVRAAGCSPYRRGAAELERKQQALDAPGLPSEDIMDAPEAMRTPFVVTIGSRQPSMRRKQVCKLPSV